MMFKLIQNIHLYAPEDKGMNDLLICGEKIACRTIGNRWLREAITGTLC